MKCQECELLLEEFLDGELGEREAASVRAHTAACAACAETHATLVAEQSLYAAYEREVEVTPQLWARIEEQIGAAPHARREAGLFGRLSAWLAPVLTAPRFSPALTGALVLLAVFGTVGAMKFLGPRGGDQLASDKSGGAAVNKNGAAVKDNSDAANDDSAANNNSDAAGQSAPSGARPTPGESVAAGREQSSPGRGQSSPADLREQKLAAGPPPKKGVREKLTPTADVNGARLASASREAEQSPDQLVREAEKRYLAAIRILERDVRGRRSRLDEQTLARFDETLASIDRTIAETRKAVRQQAGDPVAVQYMLSAYAKKVEVMREMAHLQQGN